MMKTFCLTGEFKNATKQEISKRLQKLGAIEKAGVSSKLNYLIIGGVGSDAWKDWWKTSQSTRVKRKRCKYKNNT